MRSKRCGAQLCCLHEPSMGCAAYNQQMPAAHVAVLNPTKARRTGSATSCGLLAQLGLQYTIEACFLRSCTSAVAAAACAPLVCAPLDMLDSSRQMHVRGVFWRPTLTSAVASLFQLNGMAAVPAQLCIQPIGLCAVARRLFALTFSACMGVLSMSLLLVLAQRCSLQRSLANSTHVDSRPIEVRWYAMNAGVVVEHTTGCLSFCLC